MSMGENDTTIIGEGYCKKLRRSYLPSPLTPVEEWMSSEPEYHALKIAGVVDETADSRSFVLDVPPDLADRFAYAAGQFCTFRATIGGEPVARCYSMSSSPEAGDPLTVTVKRVPGGQMSNWMNDRLVPGDAIDVLVPSGLFVLRAADVPIVAFAGGSGITPILSIVKTALLTTPREVVLVYANRDAQSVIFADALERCARSPAARLSLHHHLDSEQGFLDAAACARSSESRARGLLRLRARAVHGGGRGRPRALGVDPDRLFIERFELPDAAPAAPGAVRDGVARDPARRSEAQRRLRAGRHASSTPPAARPQAAVRVRGGNCGTCMAFVVEGEVTMRVNNALDAEEVEEGWVLTCQAIPRAARSWSTTTAERRSASATR